jgi:hypothetical protein
MVPKPSGLGAANKVGAPRLPPLPHLKVKRPNRAEMNPCLGIMSTVLGCWASSGQAAAACVNMEQQLRICMDKGVRLAAFFVVVWGLNLASLLEGILIKVPLQRPKNTKKNTINYHLSRMYPNIIGPHKRK